MPNNIISYPYKITKSERNKKNKHNSFVIWFTGLSGSGKSTIANELEKKLFASNIHTFVIDGDNLRSGINKDLGFSDNDRKENIRRVAEIAKLMTDAGIVVITSFISPFAEDRLNAKNIIGNDNFFEVYINCPIEVCEKRDPKGLYSKARKGEIKNFTGIDSEFQSPENADITVDTEKHSIEECIEMIYKLIEKNLFKE